MEKSSKTHMARSKRIKIASNLAALHFNTGSYETRTAILSHLEMTQSLCLEISADKKDKKRLFGANRDTEGATKRRGLWQWRSKLLKKI